MINFDNNTESGSERKARPCSLVAAAAKILARNGCAMNCAEIVSEVIESGLWLPRRGGKTPANTLSAAIRREIAVKWDAGRFRQVSRGLYELTG